MKKYILSIITVALGLTMATGCIEEIDPQGSSNLVSGEQAGNAIGAYDNFVSAVTSSLSGQFMYASSSRYSSYPEDFGYTSFYLQRDVMGNDLVNVAGASGPIYTWYACGTGLGSQYAKCQEIWTTYYTWIKSCNTVLSMSTDTEGNSSHASGAGIAYTVRAMLYMELAQMFAQQTYAVNDQSETVPIITENTTPADATHNPRATNEVMWKFIMDDLDKAETLLANYKRTDIYTPDITVVYGLKARANLVMQNWAEAEKYAKLAQSGYTLTTEAEYTDRNTGFNTPTGAWMMATKFKADDKNILENDADSSWASLMCLESTSGCGYASNYGYPICIDRHLYESIPATDFRRKVFVDFALDELNTKAEVITALGDYSDYQESVYATGAAAGMGVGGLSLKFRVTGGDEGHANQYIGFCVALPMMRVEEMYLIEAEAAGMQNEANGIALLTTFAKTRDANYTYGTHKDAYYNQSTSAFQNEVWWQRRVELWGEGQATLDIKRLQKGIIRSYAGTNHPEGCRWNSETVPSWMNLCIVGTEADYNLSLSNNPTPIKPTSDSSEYVW